MLTVAGIVLADDVVPKFLSQTGLEKWPYYAREWDNVERVFKAPYLTMRERMHMDQGLMTTGNRLPAKLRYLTNIQGRAGDELVKLYRRYQRFFPRFQHVDM